MNINPYNSDIKSKGRLPQQNLVQPETVNEPKKETANFVGVGIGAAIVTARSITFSSSSKTDQP